PSACSCGLLLSSSLASISLPLLADSVSCSVLLLFVPFIVTPASGIYTLSLHDALPIFPKFITCAVLFPVSDAMPSHRPFNVPVDNLTPFFMACVCLPLNTRDPLGR